MKTHLSECIRRWPWRNGAADAGASRKSRGNLRDGGEESLRVGMARGGEHFAGGAELDDLAGLHYGDARRELRDDGEAVRNQNQREREFALEAGEQFEDLRADGNVEGGNGLVCDDELRPQYQRARDADAPALPAGKFVRVAVERVRAKADGR